MNSDIKDHSNDTQHESQDWRSHSAQFAKGVTPPQTIESLHAAWGRDQELIFEQKAQISKHKETINQLRQALLSRDSSVWALIARRDRLAVMLSDIRDELDGFSGVDGVERSVFIELSTAIGAELALIEERP